MKQILLAIPVFFLVACADNDSSSDLTSPVDHLAVGDSITNQAQQVLLTNVAGAMKQGGPVHAVEFCNINASSLMDSLSELHHVSISRVSEKNRNPNNKASGFEIDLLTTLESLNLKDTVLVAQGKTTYYKSIRLGMPACIKCHGVPNEDINEATLSVLNQRYPNDLATGYKLEDFRGAWKVVFSDN